MHAWYLVITTASILAVIGLILLLIRCRRARPPFSVQLSLLEVRPLHDKPEWYIVVTAEFTSLRRNPDSVQVIRSAASAPGHDLLAAKRVCGDVARHTHLGGHPPDIALRLPMLLPPGQSVKYRFHLFYPIQLRHMWNSGTLHMYAVNATGYIVEAKISLRPPSPNVENL